MDQDNSQLEVSQPQPSESQEPVQQAQDSDPGSQTLDERVAEEREQIAELDAANDDSAEDNTSEEATNDAAEGSAEESEDKGYTPSTKFKVLDREHEFDPKLKPFLTKETEPIIRELYEKAHGIDEIKASRDQRTTERDAIQGNYNNLLGEVSRVMNYKKSGDLQSFLEACQINDEQVAQYILEKVRISQLPPEQQAVYTEREAFRRRMNALEQDFRGSQARASQAEVQQTLSDLDTTLGNALMKRTLEDFDTRNGKGSFRTAVINFAAAQPKVLSASEAVDGFIKTFGIQVPKGQPKPGPDATRRVVARPKVKTIPNYGGGQASVTATQKPKSVADLRKLAREFNA